MSKHPLIVSLNDGKYTFLCKRCGDRFTPSIPISINDYCQKLEQFNNQHKSCIETKTDTVTDLADDVIALLQSIQNTLQHPETPWQRKEAIAQAVLALLCGEDPEPKETLIQGAIE